MNHSDYSSEAHMGNILRRVKQTKHKRNVIVIIAKSNTKKYSRLHKNKFCFKINWQQVVLRWSSKNYDKS